MAKIARFFETKTSGARVSASKMEDDGTALVAFGFTRVTLGPEDRQNTRTQWVRAEDCRELAEFFDKLARDIDRKVAKR